MSRSRCTLVRSRFPPLGKMPLGFAQPVFAVRAGPSVAVRLRSRFWFSRIMQTQSYGRIFSVCCFYPLKVSTTCCHVRVGRASRRPFAVARQNAAELRPACFWPRSAPSPAARLRSRFVLLLLALTFLECFSSLFSFQGATLWSLVETRYKSSIS